MAFNPFNVFRRNQRALFAVITVFIMFTFVLSSGLGGGADFFDWLPTWLGKNKKGQQLCTLDGTKIYQGDVEKLRRKRFMANKYMELAAQVSLMQLDASLGEQMKGASPTLSRMMGFLLGQQGGDPAQKMEIIKGMLDENTAGMLGGNLTAEDKNVLRTLYAYLAIDYMRQVSGSAHLHFVNAPNRTTRDQIDFMIWEKKADEMGIRFTEEDTKALIQKEFYGQFRNDVEVRKILEKEMPGFNLDACIRAIGDEFRVRAAQTALLGPQLLFQRDDSTMSFPPLFTPPYELYDFYREKVSPTEYWVIAVPGANFVNAVSGTPTDAELRALYDKYKDLEYDPSREEPGFRQPRRIKVEWVGATGTEPYYAKKSEEFIAKSEEARKYELGLLAALTLPGVGPGAATLVVAPSAASDPQIYKSYQMDVEFKHQMNVRNQYSSATVMPWDVLDTSIIRPANLAALSGGMVGGLAGFGGPAEAASLLYGGAIKFERADRIRAGMMTFGGMIPGPGLETTALAGAAGTLLGNPAVPPIDIYRPMLLKQAREQQTKRLVKADLDKLKADVEKIAADKEIKTPAEKTAKSKELVAAFIKERGLTTGTTTDFRDEWNIEDDPGMAPLKAAMKGGDKIDPHRQVKVPVRFGKKFFWKDDFSKIDFNNPMMRQMIQAGMMPPMPQTVARGTYQPDFYTSDAAADKAGEPTYLFWRTEEQDARGLTFDQAKNSGVLQAAWKRLKARDEAKKKAEEIADRLRGRSVTSPNQALQNVLDEGKILRDQFRGDDKAAERVSIFDFKDVAPLAVTMEPGRGGVPSRTVRPFRVEPTKELPYPTPDMTKTLLDERTKPVGTVFVMADQPKDTYYVVTLTQRRVLSPREFGADVFAPFQQESGVRAGVQSAYFREARRKATESVLALLKKEFEYTETEDQTKRIDSAAKDDSEQ